MSEKVRTPGILEALFEALHLKGEARDEGAARELMESAHDFGPRGQDRALKELREEVHFSPPIGSAVGIQGTTNHPVEMNMFLDGHSPGRVIEVVMVGGLGQEGFRERFLEKLRSVVSTPRKSEARMAARRKLDGGGHLNRDEYAAAMDELIAEMAAEHEESVGRLVNPLKEENVELRSQVEALKAALGKARDTLAEQDKVLGSLVRPNGTRTSSLS